MNGPPQCPEQIHIAGIGTSGFGLPQSDPKFKVQVDGPPFAEAVGKFYLFVSGVAPEVDVGRRTVRVD